jgi:hypothetical protein
VLSFVNFYLAFLIQREYFPGRLAYLYGQGAYANGRGTKVPGMRAYEIQLGPHFASSPVASVAPLFFAGQSRITSLLSRRLQQEGVCLRSFERVQIR